MSELGALLGEYADSDDERHSSDNHDTGKDSKHGVLQHDAVSSDSAANAAALAAQPLPARSPKGSCDAEDAGEAPDGATAVLCGDDAAARLRERDAEVVSSLPPEIRDPPPGEPSEELQNKIEAWIRIQQTQHRTVNEEIRKSRGYRNPEFFRKMVEHYEIDQFSSCLPPEVFDALRLPPEDFIECLRDATSAEEARRAAQRMATGRIDFVGPSAAGAQGPYAAAGAPHAMSHAEIIAAAQAKAAALAAQAAAGPPHRAR